MCFWPENEPAPCQSLSRARLILQLLASGLVLASLFAIIAGEWFFVLYAMMLSYLLYISWARFEFTWTLFFFLIATVETITAYIWLIRMIQYHEQIRSEHATLILFGVVKLLYFPNAVMFSHVAYRSFKQFAVTSRGMGNYELMPLGGLGGSGGRGGQGGIGGELVRGQGMPVRQQSSRGVFRAFAGDGVVIG